MMLKLISNEKIAETSSKGNQEKWFDNAADSGARIYRANNASNLAIISHDK